MMNGIHDLGGMHGFGPIEPEPDERVFHEPWERRVFGMMMATFAGGQFNVDQFRHAIERMTPAHYLESSYYEHWLAALETLLVENGALTRDELEARRRALTKEVA
jgi:nitrile hydratase beta subunit